MSDVEKMYKAPDKLGDIQAPADGAAGVTPETRRLIGLSAPWLKFLGVMGFIGCGFIVLIALGLMFMPGAIPMMPGMNSMGMLSGMFAGIGVMYLGIAVLMFFPSRFAFAMGKAAGAYKFQGQPGDLETVALNLKKIVKLYGIVSIVCLAFLALGIIFGIIGAIASAMM